MIRSILFFGSNNFFIKSFSDYKKEEKKKFKIFNIVDKDIFRLSSTVILKKINKLKPSVILICGGLSGGIDYNIRNAFKILNYNTRLYQKIFDILKEAKVKKIIYLSASCIYPKNKKNLKEIDFLTGSLEETSLNYSVTKILGHCFANSINKNINAIIPATFFGKHSLKDEKNSHVISSFIKKFSKKIKKRNIQLWGSGKPRREFIYIKDLIEAILFICNRNIKDPIINIGVNKDYSIKSLAKIISKVYNFRGSIKWNKKKPDGAMKKLLDSNKIYSYGWRPKYSLSQALMEIKNDN
jgi:GDP-L-fucose synthase